MHERSHRRDGEGTEEETGTIIPSQKARKCMKEAAEEMARVQKRKLERLYPRRRREINWNAIPSREADGGSTGKVWKSTRITENVVLKVSQASVYLEKCGKSGIGKNDCVYMLEMVY